MTTITVSDIGLGPDATFSFVQFGEACSQGDVMYKDIADDDKWKVADNSTVIKAGRDGIGVALHTILQADFYGIIVTQGTMYIDGGIAEASVYVLGDATGDIVTDGDAQIGSGDFKTILGVGGDLGTAVSDLFTLAPNVTGHQIP